MINPWLTIMTGKGLHEITADLPTEGFIKSNADKDALVRSAKKRKPTYEKRKDVIDVICPLLYVCQGWIDIYKVLKFRGLIKKGNGDDLSYSSVRDLIWQARIKTGFKSPDIRIAIKDLLGKGLNPKSIAREIGVSYQFVYRVRKEKNNDKPE